jgi:hypothetical protein
MHAGGVRVLAVLLVTRSALRVAARRVVIFVTIGAGGLYPLSRAAAVAVDAPEIGVRVMTEGEAPDAAGSPHTQPDGRRDLHLPEIAGRVALPAPLRTRRSSGVVTGEAVALRADGDFPMAARVRVATVAPDRPVRGVGEPALLPDGLGDGPSQMPENGAPDGCHRGGHRPRGGGGAPGQG